MAIIKRRYTRALGKQKGMGRPAKNIPKGWISLSQLRDTIFNNWGTYINNKDFRNLVNRKIIVVKKVPGGIIMPRKSIADFVAHEHPSFAKEARNLETTRAQLIDANNELAMINEEHFKKKISISELEAKIKDELSYAVDANRLKKLQSQLGSTKKELAKISDRSLSARETVRKLGLEFNRLQSEIDKVKKK